MATQEPTETHGDGEQQPAVTRQPEEQARMPTARRIVQNPMVMMRRMLDELDRGGFGWTPGSMMRRMLDDMESVFEDLGPRDEGWAPRVEVRQHENQLVVCIDLPGVPQDQITISAGDGELVVEGERRAPSEEDELLASERAYGPFRRVIQLPDGVDADKASARFENGVLEILLAVPETHARRKIQIGDGERREEPASAAAAEPASAAAEPASAAEEHAAPAQQQTQEPVQPAQPEAH